MRWYPVIEKRACLLQKLCDLCARLPASMTRISIRVPYRAMKRRRRPRSSLVAIGCLATLGNVLPAAETSNALNHFEWSEISSPQQNDAAISVTISAKDIGGQL